MRFVCFILFVFCSLCANAQNKNKEKHKMVVITDKMREEANLDQKPDKPNSAANNNAAKIEQNKTERKRENTNTNSAQRNTDKVTPPAIHAGPSKTYTLTKDESVRIEETKRIKEKNK